MGGEGFGGNVGVLRRFAHDGDVDVALQQRRDDVAPVAFLKVDGDARVGRLKAGSISGMMYLAVLTRPILA